MTILAPSPVPVWQVAHRIGCGSRQVLDLLNHLYGDYPDTEAMVALGQADEHGKEGDG